MFVVVGVIMVVVESRHCSLLITVLTHNHFCAHRSSKCVMRSNYDPHVIVEKSDCDDKPFENSSQACGSQNPESKSRSNMMMLSSGRAESGYALPTAESLSVFFLFVCM